jgi:hypothetical protein
MKRIILIKLRAVTAMAEVMLLRAGMVEMLLLVTTGGITVEMSMLAMAVMETVMEMEMGAMAEVGMVMVMVTQETQMTKPMIKKS